MWHYTQCRYWPLGRLRGDSGSSLRIPRLIRSEQSSRCERSLLTLLLPLRSERALLEPRLWLRSRSSAQKHPNNKRWLEIKTQTIYSSDVYIMRLSEHDCWQNTCSPRSLFDPRFFSLSLSRLLSSLDDAYTPCSRRSLSLCWCFLLNSSLTPPGFEGVSEPVVRYFRLRDTR